MKAITTNSCGKYEAPKSDKKEIELIKALEHTCKHSEIAAEQCRSFIKSLHGILESMARPEEKAGLGAVTICAVIEVNLKKDGLPGFDGITKALLRDIWQAFSAKFSEHLSGEQSLFGGAAKLATLGDAIEQAKSFLHDCDNILAKSSSNSTNSVSSSTAQISGQLPTKTKELTSGLNSDYNHLQDNKNCGIVGCFIIGKIAQLHNPKAYPNFKLDWKNLEPEFNYEMQNNNG